MQAAIEEDRSRRNKLRGQQNELSEILQSLYLKQNTARMNLEAIREKTENLRMDYQSLQGEGREIEKQIGEIHQNRQEIRREMDHSREQESSLEQMISDVTAELEALHSQEQEAAASQDRERLAYANLQQKCEFLEMNIRSVRDELESCLLYTSRCV